MRKVNIEPIRGIWLLIATAGAMLPTCNLLFDGEASGKSYAAQVFISGAAWAAAWWGWANLRPARSSFWRAGGLGGVLTTIVCIAVLLIACCALPWHVARWQRISYAIVRGDTEVVAAELNHGEDPDMRAPSGPLSPLPPSGSFLEIAAENDNEQAIEVLLAHGARLNNFEGESSSLRIAVDNRDREMVQYLLRHGAELSTRVTTDSGDSCDLTTSCREFPEIAHLLSEANAPSE